jgi:hypothetical protein
MPQTRHRSIVLLPSTLLTACTVAACTVAACTVRGEPAIEGGAPPASDAGAAAPWDGGPRPDVVPFDAGVCADVVDVVFVLDVSSSMSFVLEQLESDVARVVSAAEELAPDPHFGIVAYADSHAFALGGALDEGRVHTGAATLQSAFRDVLSVYTSQDRNPGDGPSGPTRQNPVCEENSLDALVAAASEFPWRPSATRVIIVATDDTFLERPDNYGDRDGDGRTDRTDFPREGDYPARSTLAETVDAVRSARARVFSFTRITPPTGLADLLTRCGTPRRHPWESVSSGWSQPYDGADPIPGQTDGRNFDLIGVRDGRLSLADTIAEVVVESYCQPPLF